MLRTLVGFLCICFAVSADAKLGETVPQLVKRFGKSYSVESVQVGKKYKFRSASISVDAVVANGVSVGETYLSDHPLISGEPSNDIVRTVLKTNAPKARWVEIEAAPFEADYALRSSDNEYIAILKYTGPQPENSVWIMTVGLAKAISALSSAASPSASPSPTTATAMSTSTPSPIPSLFATAAPGSGRNLRSPFDLFSLSTPHIDFSPPTPPHFEGVKAKAETGDSDSEYQLGLCYYKGNGVKKDFSEAVNWYRKAAEQGLPAAQSALAGCYLLGEGVPKDFTEAVKWSRKAAEQGDSMGQFNLGRAYYRGEGVARNLAEAVEWFRKAAEQGLAKAQSALARCYYRGEGVSKDLGESVKWSWKAAQQGDGIAQAMLGYCYLNGDGVRKNLGEAAKWYRKAAEQGIAGAQGSLGTMYFLGEGVAKNAAEGLKWSRKAAEQGDGVGQCNLGEAYRRGEGVPKDFTEAVMWLRKAAEQNNVNAQTILGLCYAQGEGVPKDDVQAYKWWLLAAAKGNEAAKKNIAIAESKMTRDEIAQGQSLARDFTPYEIASSGADSSSVGTVEARPKSAGTGFFITEDGFLVTNAHVAAYGAQVRLLTQDGVAPAKVIQVDSNNDLALLKAQGRFAALPVATSRAVKLGDSVATIGFPNIGMQGFAPKFARGEIASLSGTEDDPRFFQISVPLQPGNSGGALVDEHGNVVGIVSAKLSAAAALKATGELPENVNYAVKSSFLLGFLESVPEVASKLKEPNTSDIKFAEVVEKARGAAVLVLVY